MQQKSSQKQVNDPYLSTEIRPTTLDIQLKGVEL